MASHIGAGAPAAANPALLHLILDVLDDNKAEETVVIDLRGKSALADEMDQAEEEEVRTKSGSLQ